MARSDPKRAEIDQALADADPEARAKLRRMLQNPQARDAVLHQAPGPGSTNDSSDEAVSEEEAREIEDARAYYLSTGEFRKALDRAAVGRHVAKRTGKLPELGKAHEDDAPRVHDASAETLDLDASDASSKSARSAESARSATSSPRRQLVVGLFMIAAVALMWFFWPRPPQPTATAPVPSPGSDPSIALAATAAPPEPTADPTSSAPPPAAPESSSPSPPVAKTATALPTKPPASPPPATTPTPPPAPPASSAPWEGIYP